jgi:hypothetical protein
MPPIYEIINPHDPYTMRAANIETAAAAIAFLTEGQAGVSDITSGEHSPVLIGWEPWLTQRGMLPLAPWMKAHRDELCAALASIRIGTPADRPAHDAAEALVPARRRIGWLRARNQRMRSSITDFEAPAHLLAIALAKRLADADPTEQVN